jgi:acetyl-CoA carboxylase biotin carboxylase subunit
MGSKARAKQTIQDAGLPVIPGSDGHLESLDSALQLADRIGYPILLKATAGGGGKGIRPCHSPDQLKRNYSEAAIEAEKAFGSDRLYLEKLITSGRHIEFQILADSYQQVIHLGERECSIQRKNQKLIEESPSPAIDPPTRIKTGRRLASAIRKMGYQNAGTVEFLRDPKGHLYFMEMNTRLQVEHPVTEEICGVDIVAAQIQIAANHPLSFKQKDIRFSGHALECRINAEDPSKDFQPSPGKITRFHIPLDTGPGRIRLETHVREGYRIPSFYDSMICKVIAWGKDRPTAIETMIRTLKQSHIGGIKTTIPLHIKILNSDIFRKGKTHTDSLEKIMGGE